MVKKGGEIDHRARTKQKIAISVAPLHAYSQWLIATVVRAKGAIFIPAETVGEATGAQRPEHVGHR